MSLMVDLEDDPFGSPPTDWRTPEGVAEVERAKEEAKRRRPRETRFGRVSFGELRDRKARAPEYVVDDWLVAREQSFLAGESQSGKSFLGLHAALCIATGREVFGRKVAPGLVIYQAGESGTGVLDLRIPAWLQHFAPDLPPDIPFEILPARINLWDPDGARQFANAIEAIAAEYPAVPLRAVFIDTTNKAMTGANENDGRDMGKVLAAGETISRATGAHVCFLHHFTKNAKQMRGHGSLKGDTDCVALVHCDEQTKIRTLVFDKMKDGERGGKIQFELMQVRLGERADGKPITSCVVLPVGEKAKARQDALQSAAVNENEKMVLEAIFKAIDEQGLPAPAALQLPPSTRVADYAVARKLFAKMVPTDDVETYETDEERETAQRRHLGKLKTRLKRAREYMTVNTKIIRVQQCPDPVSGKPTDFVWWTGRPVRGFPRTQPPKPKEEPAPEVLSETGEWAPF